jgi:valyl-tRNA synthetase
MSKSLGNGIDPIDVMNQYGPDALRATLVFAAPEGEDPKLSPTSFEQGRNFANKLWNAARFVQMSVPNLVERASEGIPSKIDNWAYQWILGRWDLAVAKVTRELEAFRFNTAALALYELFWHDFADWYLELSKVSLRQGSEEQKKNTERVLASLLRRMLVLLHPYVPFVTEELFSSLGFLKPGQKSITEENWQELPFDIKTSTDLNGKVELFQKVVAEMRNLRSEAQVPPGQKVPFEISFDQPELLEFFKKTEPYLADMARALELKLGLNLPQPEGARLAVLAHIQIYLKLEEKVDTEAMKKKLTAELERVTGLVSSTSARLSDPQFSTKAPEMVRLKEKEKLVKLESMQKELQENLQKLGI